ncbi:MAG TPA: nicotinamide mononucleotide transporter [Clostridiales bacterium]|nr:nicotinamide mononucleotide transporter [Clostridiales bacterium]
MLKRIFCNFKKIDFTIWIVSCLTITFAFALSKFKNVLSFIGSLIGVTSLIFNAKGNVVGQFLSVGFAIFYGIVSATFKYWGETITYLCMSLPVDIIAVISWLKHPYSKQEVKVEPLNLKKLLFAIFSAIIVTTIMYFVLKKFNTPNLLFSTISVITSWFAVVFVVMRSSYYAVAYGLNDIVLIILWSLASVKDKGYLPMVACFITFLINDVYGFINWCKMEKRQNKK